MLHGSHGCTWEPQSHYQASRGGLTWNSSGSGGSGHLDTCDYRDEEALERAYVVKALQGPWVNADCPGERYVVSGQHVTRTDAQGSRHFTLQWDQRRKQLQWGTHGRLYLTWQGDGLVAWVPSRHRSRAWRWQRNPQPPAVASPVLLPAMWCPPPCPATAPGHYPLSADSSGGYGPWRRPYSRGPSRGQPYLGHHAPRGGQRVEPSVFDLLFREITPDDYETLLRLDETVSRPTVSAASIERLPTCSGKDLCGEECSVCLASFKDDDVVATLPCRHSFHRDCIGKWLSECRRACPLCGDEALEP